MTKIKYLSKLPSDLLLEIAFQKIGRRLASLLKNTPVTPNQITLLKIPLAFLLILFGFNFQLIPIALIIFSSKILDKVDGALARATNQETDFGAWLDMFLDRLLWGTILFTAAHVISKELNNPIPWIMLSLIFFSSLILNNLIFANSQDLSLWHGEKIKVQKKLNRTFKSNLIYQIIFSFYYLFDQMLAISLLLYYPIKLATNLNSIFITLLAYLVFFVLAIAYVSQKQFENLKKNK